MLALTHLSTVTAVRNAYIPSTKRVWRQFFDNLLVALSGSAW